MFAPSPFLSAKGLFDVVRRRLLQIAGVVVAGLALAVLYLVVTPPLYKATVRLLIENQTPKINNAQAVSSEAGGPELAVLSQVEVLRSPRLAERVIRATNLFGANDKHPARPVEPATPAEPSGTEDTGKSPPPTTLPTDVVEAFMRRLTVSRVGPTTLIQVEFASSNADTATRVANALATEYLESQVEAKNSVTRRATEWLKKRVAELREQIRSGEERIERFKTENNLFKVGQMTIDERVLSTTAEQLSAARAAEAAAASRLEQMERIQNEPGQLMSLGRALQSDTIREYRRQYAEVARKRASIVSRFGQQHPEVANADAELKDLDKQISLEVSRIVSSARSDFDLTKIQSQQLESKLAQLKRQIHETNQLTIELIEMERQLQTTSALYSSLLARLQELESLETLNGPDARIVSYAFRPFKPAEPRKTLVLGLTLVASMFLGFAYAFFSEYMHPTFVAPGDTERTLGVQCIASIPLVAGPATADRGTGPLARLLWAAATARAKAQPLVRACHAQLVRLGLSAPHLPANEGSGGATTPDDTPLRPVLHTSTSAFSEAIFAIHNALDASLTRSDGCIVAVASASADEGKTTIAIGIGDYFATSGKKVLLVDANLRDTSLTKALAPNAKLSFLDVLSGQHRISETLQVDQASGLTVCPAPSTLGKQRPMDVLASPAMADLLASLRAQYDLIIVDTSPFARTADPRPMFRLADTTILVVEYAVSRIEDVRTAMRDSGLQSARLLGAVLNKRPASALA